MDRAGWTNEVHHENERYLDPRLFRVEARLARQHI
jgi:hypothetical protein